LICKKTFKVKPNVVRKGFGKYCSTTCRGIAYVGDGNPKWRGGGTMEHQGYRLLYQPDHPYKNKDGYVREHRLVMEKKLDRYLMPIEVVHHINGIKNDNRIENLQLFNTHSDHFKHEIKNGKIPLDYWKGKTRRILYG